jgi:ribosomal protein S18 acetylase RimI-like enzyme
MAARTRTTNPTKPGRAPKANFLPIAKKYLEGVIFLCRAEGWTSFYEPATAWKALTGPGVITFVAVQADRVIGFAQLQSDGHIQAHLSNIAVASDSRRRGIARRLIEECFARSGAKRIDLVSVGRANTFYESFDNRSYPGFRIYPKPPR